MFRKWLAHLLYYRFVVHSRNCQQNMLARSTVHFSHSWALSSSVVPFSSRLQSFPASGPFSNESVLSIRCPKYWSFSFSISPSNEYSGLISCRIDWLALLAVQLDAKMVEEYRTERPLSPRQIHWKTIWTLSKFHKTTSENRKRTPGTQKGSPLSSKGGRTKYKR